MPTYFAATTPGEVTGTISPASSRTLMAAASAVTGVQSGTNRRSLTVAGSTLGGTGQQQTSPTTVAANGGQMWPLGQQIAPGR